MNALIVDSKIHPYMKLNIVLLAINGPTDINSNNLSSINRVISIQYNQYNQYNRSN